MSFDVSRALACLEEAKHLYSRLAIVVGPSGAGKSALLAEMANRLSGKVDATDKSERSCGTWKPVIADMVTPGLVSYA